MKAITITPHTKELFLIDTAEPVIKQADDVKIKIWHVGICGTDREEASGGRAEAAEGKKRLIIGHEMFGQVTETGSRVTKVKPGDFAVFTVRRGCGKCRACLSNRSDMCYSGDYTERGIKGADGYQAEYVVDSEQYLVKVPEEIADIGVLTEPMSVAAKAIDEAIKIQEVRLKDFDDPGNWLNGKRALVAGIGPIGLLAAFALRLKGADVIGLDIVDEQNIRVQLLKAIGGQYANANIEKTTNGKIQQIDFVFEATGIAQLQFQLIDTLGINAIYVATGIPSGERPVTVRGAELMQRLVLMNQMVLGSVNASTQHYLQAVDYLIQSKKNWPDAIRKVITHRFPLTAFLQAFHQHSADEIKAIVDWVHE